MLAAAFLPSIAVCLFLIMIANPPPISLIAVAEAATNTNQSSAMVLGSSFSPLLQQPLIISSSNKFSFGFRNLTNDDTFYVAVWYSNLDNTIVWVANRDSPVTTAAFLNFSTTGNLVLLQEGSSTIVWQSNTIGLGVVRAQIQDSGNLVLLNTSGHTVWQSFDFPTDTLLPGQQITTAAALTSRKTAITYYSGYFALDFSTGAVELKYTGRAGVPYVNAGGFPGAYWSLGAATNLSSISHPVAAQFNQSGVLTFFNSSSAQNYVLASFIPADNGATDAPIRRLALDLDGNLRIYVWDESTKQWLVQWRAIDSLCSFVQGLCGPNGICISNSNFERACICPSGFDVADINDISQGCVRRLSIDCSSTQYVMLDNTDFLFNDYMLVSTGLSVEQCKQSCAISCTCVAVVYALDGTGTCWLKSALVNGYNPSFNDRITFIKVSNAQPSTDLLLPSNEAVITNWTSMVPVSGPPTATPPASLPALHGRRSFPTAAVVVCSVTVAETVCFGITLWFCLRKKAAKQGQSKQKTPTTSFSLSPIMFSYQELEVATGNFSERLGSGGFGTVFKGQLEDGRLVAVKRLEGLSQREEQFRAEVTTMTTTHHMHLLRFYGLCAEDDHRLLVYEYVENGSLDRFLFREPIIKQKTIRTQALDWKTRFNICLGTARAIAYLHEDCIRCIIHCDIKPQNILVDASFSPKVADFGLAYLFSRNHTLQVTTIHGTRGYLAPEWFSNVPITAKADVFSFGMLLLEIVSGRSNFSFTSSTALTTNKWCFPVWAFEQMREGNLLEVMDSSMPATIEYEQVERVMKVAFWCIQEDLAARPTMGKVVQMLLGDVPFPDPPSPLAELLY